MAITYPFSIVWEEEEGADEPTMFATFTVANEAGEYDDDMPAMIKATVKLVNDSRFEIVIEYMDSPVDVPSVVAEDELIKVNIPENPAEEWRVVLGHVTVTHLLSEFVQQAS